MSVHNVNSHSMCADSMTDILKFRFGSSICNYNRFPVFNFKEGGRTL